MKKILGLIIIIILAVITITLWPKTGAKPEIKIPTPQPQNQKPQIISTKPDPLEEAIVSATEVIEITFNKPLENKGEFKLKIDPNIDFKIELSSDRKTAKIIPENPYELGKTYTIFIGTETKFDGIGRWGEEKIFHIKTIPYRGV